MANRTILLKDRGVRKEGIALAALQPGYLVEVDLNGKIIAHASAGENASPAFVVENELVGNDITVAIPAGDQVVYETLGRGAEVLAVLAASAAAIIIGDYLESAGDGTMRIVTAAAATTQAERSGVILRAIEAVDNSGGGTEVFIETEVL